MVHKKVFEINEFSQIILPIIRLYKNALRYRDIYLKVIKIPFHLRNYVNNLHQQKVINWISIEQLHFNCASSKRFFRLLLYLAQYFMYFFILI